MSSKRLIRRALAVLVLAIATMTPGSSGASPSAMNVNSIYNVQAYGAVGNGVTDDSAAEQAAIDAACAASSVGAPATVYWPAPSSFYATCSPLFVHCSGLRLLKVLALVLISAAAATHRRSSSLRRALRSADQPSCFRAMG